MRKHVRNETEALLRRLAFQLGRVSSSPDPDAVHDVRVAIRRLRRCLRLFSDFFPGDGGRKIRRELRRMMETAAETRDVDVALELLAKAGVPSQTALLRKLKSERRSASRALQIAAQRWRERNRFGKWRAWLETEE